MRIFLIGFMGCGKSTFGRKLAAKLGSEFIDLDQQFEKETGRSINEYFAEHGEDAFREQESRVLKTIDYPINCVVATGGGTPCYFDNIQWMNGKGLTIYIDMSPVEMAGRLEKGKAKRPLLKNLSETEIVDFIKLKLSERETYYKRAFITIRGRDLTFERLRTRLFQIF